MPHATPTRQRRTTPPRPGQPPPRSTTTPPRPGAPPRRAPTQGRGLPPTRQAPTTPSPSRIVPRTGPAPVIFKPPPIQARPSQRPQGQAERGREEQDREARRSEAEARAAEIANQRAREELEQRRREESNRPHREAAERAREEARRRQEITDANLARQSEGSRLAAAQNQRELQQRESQRDADQARATQAQATSFGQGLAGQAETRAGAESREDVLNQQFRRSQSGALTARLLSSLTEGGGGDNIQLPRVDDSAAQAARFGAAKEQIGETTQGSLRALDDVLAGSGFAEAPSGGAEAAIRGNIVRGGGQGLADVTRGNLIAGSEREERANALQFQGDLGRQRDRSQNRLAIQQLLERARLF